MTDHLPLFLKHSDIEGALDLCYGFQRKKELIGKTAFETCFIFGEASSGNQDMEMVMDGQEILL